MKLKKIHIISLVLGLTLLMSVSFGTAVTVNQASSDNVTVETDEIVVKITGGTNVPMYQFWDIDNTDTTYKLQFSQAFEAEDDATDGTEGTYDVEHDKKVTGTLLALSSATWTFSEIDERNDGSVHFDMSTTLNSGTIITFQNHIEGTDANSLKFDVIIENYEFSSENAMLVFSFKLTQTEGDDETSAQSQQDGDTVSFGDGFFQSEETATADGQNVNVGLSTGNEEGDSKIFLSYENFNGNLTHDPTVGVQAAVSNPDDSNQDGPNLGDATDGPGLNASDETWNLWVLGISKEEAGLSTFLASFLALAIPVAIYRSRK